MGLCLPERRPLTALNSYKNHPCQSELLWGLIGVKGSRKCINTMTSNWMLVPQTENLTVSALSPWTPSCKFDFFRYLKVNPASCSCLKLSVSCIYYICSHNCDKWPDQSWSVTVLRLAAQPLAALQFSPNSVLSSSYPQTHHFDHHHSHQSVNHITGQWGICSNVTSCGWKYNALIFMTRKWHCNTTYHMQ